MSKIRTAIDANLLIAAWSAEGDRYALVLRVLEASNRHLIVSDALWLEVMPKATFHHQQAERRFYEAVFHQRLFLSIARGCAMGDLTPTFFPPRFSPHD